MDVLNTVSLESNSRIKINFDGGDLSSDAGLLLLKEFCYKIGAVKLIKRLFQTNDSASYRTHKDDDNLLQVIYQIFAAYFEDDCADELTNEPVISAVLEKESPASQPTLSRFFHHLSTIIGVNVIEEIAAIGESKNISYKDLAHTLIKIKAGKIDGKWVVYPIKRAFNACVRKCSLIQMI